MNPQVEQAIMTTASAIDSHRAALSALWMTQERNSPEAALVAGALGCLALAQEAVVQSNKLVSGVE